MAQILLIEPDATLSQTYRMALKIDGHNVTPVFTAQTAINIADRQSPDLVILELQLPVHNGVEFLYEFRSYTEWRSTPVIVQSFVPPSDFRSSAILWRNLGVVAYLYKPRTSLRQLLISVQEQLTAITA